MSGPATLRETNLLDVVPVRLAKWEDHDDHVIIIRPRPRAAWYLLPLEWLRYLMAVRRIRGGPIVAAVWRACDGRTTVREVVARVREAFGDDAEPAEDRVGELARRLRREGLLAYRDLDPLPGTRR